MTSILKIAIKAAKAAGIIHKQHYGRVRNIQFKSHNKLNLVTEVDTLCEKRVLSILKQSFPDHNYWGEESGKDAGTSQYTWLIDPLDGTTNYAHAYPFFCCSIALIKNNIPTLKKGGGGDLAFSPSPLRGEGRGEGGKHSASLEPAPPLFVSPPQGGRARIACNSVDFCNVTGIKYYPLHVPMRSRDLQPATHRLMRADLHYSSSWCPRVQLDIPTPQCV